MTSSSSNKDNQTVKDHHGKEYGSFELMCKAWHTDSYTVRSRLNRGWSLERALVEKVNKTNGGSSCKDHLGNQYKSKMAMCRAYGISYNVFTYRIRDGGMSIEEALTTPVKKQKDAIYDKSGNFLGYGVSRTAVKYNMCREQFLKELENSDSVTYRDKNKNLVECEDHLGNKFESIRAMCNYYNIETSDFYYRIKSGWGLEEALTCKSQSARRRNIMTIDNKTYVNLEEACRSYNISSSTVRNRLKHGWTLEDALKTPVNKKMSRK